MKKSFLLLCLSSLVLLPAVTRAAALADVQAAIAFAAASASDDIAFPATEALMAV